MLSIGRIYVHYFLSCVFISCRLRFTLHCIAFLFRTSHKGHNDLDLEELREYMNARHHWSKEGPEFTVEELTELVKMLRDRKKLTFERGGLGLVEDPYA